MSIQEIDEILENYTVKRGEENDRCVVEFQCPIYEGIEVMNYLFDLYAQYKRVGFRFG